MGGMKKQPEQAMFRLLLTSAILFSSAIPQTACALMMIPLLGCCVAAADALLWAFQAIRPATGS